MKKLAAVLPLVVLMAGCVMPMHKSRPCVVKPTPPPIQAVQAETPAVVPAPIAQTPAPAEVVTPAPVVQPPVDYAALFAANVKDIYFDFDKSTIRADQKAVLNADIAFFRQYPNVLFEIVGSCDVVGGDKYNNALGQWRVNTVKEALNEVGVFETSATTLGKTSSYGKDHQSNRRVHFTYSGVR